MSAGTVDHTLDKYVQLKETYPDMVDDNQIVKWLMLSILAGGDTSSATIRAAVYYLAKSPTAMIKLAAELKAAGISTPAPWKEIRDLQYLDAVIREALRVNPGVAMILERIVPEGGFTLPDGRYLPAGTKAGINPFVTNRDFGVFGDDADDFNPDRWLQDKNESPENFEVRLRRMKDTVDLSFGGGGRVCMGRYLAILEIKKLIASLYSSFDVSGLLAFLGFQLLGANFRYRFNWWTPIMNGRTKMPGSCISTICPWSSGADEMVCPWANWPCHLGMGGHQQIHRGYAHVQSNHLEPNLGKV